MASSAAIPASDTELLQRARRNSNGFVEVAENSDLSQADRLYALCVFLANEQRGYEDPEQLTRILSQYDSSKKDYRRTVQEAIAYLRDRGRRVIRATARDWEHKLWTRRRQLEDDVVSRHLHTGGIRLIPDQPGVGKTTSPSRGLLRRGVRHFLACDRHEKAVDHKNKDVITEESQYFHRRGVSQPRFDCCFDEDDCEHDSENPPLMCPVYERDKADPVRQEFKRVERIHTHGRAHEMVADVPDNCHWLDHRAELDRQDPDYVIGVHQHLTEFSNRDVVVIDETPKITTYQQEWSTSDLGRAASLLVELPGGRWLGEWVDELRDSIVNADREQVSLTVAPPDEEITADELAELKAEFNEMLLAENDDFDFSERTQPCFDAILGALVQVGFKPDECRKAIDAQNTSDYCPWCNVPVEGGRCVQCRWNKEEYGPLPRDPSHPRVCAYMDSDAIVYTEIPDPEDLPDSVILTDATPQPKLIAAFFGISVDEIWHEVGPEFDLNTHLIEFRRGQYHAQIIHDSEKLRKRIQRTIDIADRKHRKVLYVVKSSLEGYFQFPEGNIVRHYGAVKGLDFTDVDAVVMIGALHIHIEQARHIAEALTLDNPDIEVGGEEITETRTIHVDGEPAEEETKAYTGLVGAMFKSPREDGFVQVAHRPRPIYSETEIAIYKLSNVPTSLPVDERVTWSKFLNEGLSFGAMKGFIRHLCDTVDGDEAEFTTPQLKRIANDDVSDRSVELWVTKLVKMDAAEEILNIGDLRTNKYRIDMKKLRRLG